MIDLCDYRFWFVFIMFFFQRFVFNLNVTVQWVLTGVPNIRKCQGRVLKKKKREKMHVACSIRNRGQVLVKSNKWRPPLMLVISYIQEWNWIKNVKCMALCIPKWRLNNWQHTFYLYISYCFSFVFYHVLFFVQATPAMSTLCILNRLCRSDFSFPTFFSLYFFAFQLHLCRKRLTWSNGYLEVIFHALDVFSIIIATVYVEVLNRHLHGRHIVCFDYVDVLAEVRTSSKQQ